MKQPAIGSIIHFVYGTTHCAAIVTDPAYRVQTDAYDAIEQAMVVFPPNASSFTTCAMYDAGAAPATWHWAEPSDQLDAEEHDHGQTSRDGGVRS